MQRENIKNIGGKALKTQQEGNKRQREAQGRREGDVKRIKYFIYMYFTMMVSTIY